MSIGLGGWKLARRACVPSFSRLVELLVATQLSPRTVFDIGVAYGTPWLYTPFRSAKFYLVDPTRESMPYMQRWARKLDASILNVALGDATGEAEIDVRPSIDGASLYREIGPYVSSAKYSVPVRRFDELIADFERPALCKIDVQGAEVSVLRGMGDLLRRMDVVIVETSLIATIYDAPECADVFALMTAADFVLYDIIDLRRRPLDGALGQVDAVFVPRHSPLRADRRWRERL